MPGFDEDPFARPAPVANHTLGENVDALSAPELEARIALCRQEIERLENAKAAREATKAAADSYFRR